MLVFIALLHWRFFDFGLFFYVTDTSPWVFESMKTSTSSELYPGYLWFLPLSGFLLLFCLILPRVLQL